MTARTIISISYCIIATECSVTYTINKENISIKLKRKAKACLNFQLIKIIKWGVSPACVFITPSGKVYVYPSSYHDDYKEANIDCLVVKQYVKYKDSDDQVWCCKGCIK